MYEEDFYSGFEPNENESEDNEYIRDCDYCGEEIHAAEDVIAILAPDGEKLVIHEDEDISLTELLDLLGVRWVSAEARDIDTVLRNL